MSVQLTKYSKASPLYFDGTRHGPVAYGTTNNAVKCVMVAEDTSVFPESEEHLAGIVTDALLAISASLDNPSSAPRVSLCSTAISSAIHLFWNHPGHPSCRSCSVRKDYGNLLDAFCCFLSLPRNPKRLATLQDLLRECRCDLSNSAVNLLHHPTLAYPDCMDANGNGVGFASCLFKFMSQTVSFISIGEIAVAPLKTRRKHVRTRLWPESASSLLPDGPAAFLSAVFEWFQFMPDKYPALALTGDLLHRCPSLAQELFSWPQLISAAAAYLVSIPEILDAKIKDDVAPERLRELVYMTRNFFENLFGLGVHIWNFVVSQCDIDAVNNALTRILAQLPSIAGQELSGDIRNLQILFSFHNNDKRQIPSTIDLDYKQHLKNCKIVDDAYHQLTNVFWAFFRAPYCSGPQCLRSTEHERQGSTSFGACGTCGVVRYCGKSCQSRSWKGIADSDPHKSLCRDFARFKKLCKELQKAGHNNCVSGAALEENGLMESYGFSVERLLEMKAALQRILNEKDQLRSVAAVPVF